MKIGIISNLYPPFVRGGAEVIARTMAQGLSERLQHVFVVSTQPFEGMRSLIPRERVDDGIKIYRFFPLNLYFYLSDYRFPLVIRTLWRCIDMLNLHSYYCVRRILLKERPDVVITHNLTGIGFLIPALLHRLGIRHVHVLHDVQLVEPSGIILHGHEFGLRHFFLRCAGYHALMRKLFSTVSVVISPSKFLLDFYRRHRFFEAVESKIMTNPIRMPATVPRRQVPHDELRLLYIGQLTPGKGIMQLADVVRSTRVPVSLAVIGSGPLLLQLRKKAEEDPRITLLGWRTHADVELKLSESDIVVVPTLCYDNSPTVVLEALSHGVPVIASDIGGAKELIRVGTNGWIFPVEQWSELQRLIEWLAAHRDEIRRAAAVARSSIENASVAEYCSRLLTVLEAYR